MPTKIYALLLIVSFIFLACNSDPNKRLEEGEISDDIYHNQRFGLQVNVPSDWRVITKLEEELMRKKGGELSKEEFGDNRSDTWTPLLQIQKGISANQMMINYSLYKPELHGNNYQNSKETRFRGMKQVLERTAGVEVETIRTETEIDQILFDTYNMLIRKNGEIAAYQIMLEKKYENDEVLLIGLLAKDRTVLEELRSITESMKIKKKD